MTPESRTLLGLMSRGLPPHIAQGITANLIAESRLDSGINEKNPVVPGSRGGYGLAQWTGPRRRALEAEAQRRGVDVSDFDFQLDYLMHELQGPERRAFEALQGARTAEEAARVFSDRFLRPGIPHMDKRLAEARRLSGSEPGAGTPPFFQVDTRGTYRDPGSMYAASEPVAETGARNALALPEQEPRQPAPALAATLDPADFMTAAVPNALAPVEFRARSILGRRA